MPANSERDDKTIRAQCTHFVSHHYQRNPHEVLTALADFTPPDMDSDIYGGGKLMEDFEAEIAQMLGKPAAVFMPSGTMAQQIALRIHAEQTGNDRMVFHPTCHLEVHEQMGYRELHNLKSTLVGNPHNLMTLDDLKAVREPFGTLLLELPQRPIGGLLPSWDDLTAIASWARVSGIRLHMDGARLWESAPFYDRDYAEIAGLFDTVYVSFYKMLNGITGAVLAGSEDFIHHARVWQRRHGGNLVRMFPFVQAAKMGLEEHLPKMRAYYEKAVEVAAGLSAIDGIEIKPNPPHTNMMHVFLRGSKEALDNARRAIAEAEKVWLYHWVSPAQIPAYQVAELVMGNAALDLETDRIVNLYADLMRRVKGL